MGCAGLVLKKVLYAISMSFFSEKRLKKRMDTAQKELQPDFSPSRLAQSQYLWPLPTSQ
jgi:hypothetical protein